MKTKKNISSRSADKNITDAELTLGALLRRPYDIMALRVYGELASSGFEDIRPAHSAVFRHIQPNGSWITEMAERAQMTKQSMGALVDHLRERGYVEVRPDPSDARARLICLTERGRAVQQTAMKISREVEREIGSLMGEEEALQLRRLLERLYFHLEEQGL